MIASTRSPTKTVVAGLGRFDLPDEWGGIVVTCMVLAFALMGIGDAGLRPALRRLDPELPGGVATARKWAIAGLAVGILALMMMTRAIYART